MRVRGERECRDCGSRWSYYETGSVTCPDCGSVHSTGVDERQLHTDGAATLDLTPARAAVDDRPLAEVAEAAAPACREYVRARGFVRGGDLLVLDDTYLAARELAGVADVLRRALSRSDDEELYFLALLRGADDGDRPPPGDVPATLRGPRGLAAADGVEAYRRDVSAWLDEHPDPAARETLSALSAHERRIRALDGDVPPAEADRLVAAARDVGRYLGARGDVDGEFGGGTVADSGEDGAARPDEGPGAGSDGRATVGDEGVDGVPPDEAVDGGPSDEAALARAEDRLARLGDG